MAALEGVGVQVNLIDRDIEMILKALNHHMLARSTNQIKQLIEAV